MSAPDWIEQRARELATMFYHSQMPDWEGQMANGIVQLAREAHAAGRREAAQEIGEAIRKEELLRVATNPVGALYLNAAAEIAHRLAAPPHPG